ncbi:hypothetical protein K432DRAFT_421733 [Lepidopterella palustris CBS 459.81]|uniref:Uncharacterized protein n=1 Tax=Lepidopterella palustris CBS 459.81 TaxID=1314670 RepID=A0A8E2EK46_9PEZI|nr:hypothetical protein K432DRAFT_421733 [Lepidopterella palustris CBS 459.81]
MVGDNSFDGAGEILEAPSPEQIQKARDSFQASTASKNELSPQSAALGSNEAGTTGSTNGQHREMPHQMPDSEDAEWMAKMPALFDLTLPPVSPENQIAYERLVLILRERWLLSKGARSAMELCRELKDELADEARMNPPHLKGWKQNRKPWRRERVFQFEIQWAKWFVWKAGEEERSRTGRESRTVQELMDEGKERKPVLMIENQAHRDDDEHDAWSSGGGE